MVQYLAKRIGRSVLTLFIIVTLVFCLLLAGLLTALGLDECILAGRQELVEYAVRLGNDGQERARLRQRLCGRLPGARLFDPKAMAVDLERLYRAMHANALAGEHATIRLSD